MCVPVLLAPLRTSDICNYQLGKSLFFVILFDHLCQLVANDFCSGQTLVAIQELYDNKRLLIPTGTDSNRTSQRSVAEFSPLKVDRNS